MDGTISRNGNKQGLFKCQFPTKRKKTKERKGKKRKIKKKRKQREREREDIKVLSHWA